MAGGIKAITGGMQGHEGNARVQDWGCGALSISARNADDRVQIAELTTSRPSSGGCGGTIGLFNMAAIAKNANQDDNCVKIVEASLKG